MDKDTIKKLTKPFSKDDVKPAPKGKFGSYVPHHLVTKRLNEHAFGQWSHTCKEVIRNYKGEVRGVITTFTLFGVSHDEVGDVDTNDVKNNNTEGELLKLCMSDALKRGAMRHGIGLHLWTGETTEEEHYANKTNEMSKVQVEKKPIRQFTKPGQAAMKKVVDEMVSPSEEEVARTDDTQEMIKEGKFTDVGKQLNQLLEAMIPDQKLRQEIKAKAYNELVSNGLADKDIKSWTKENMDVFMTRAEDMFNAMGIDNEIEQTKDKDLVEEVFGEVTESVVKTCPECNSPDWIEDNREKKAEEPEKFGKIPSWSCSTYQGNQGCGWVAWGDTDCPTEWL